MGVSPRRCSPTTRNVTAAELKKLVGGPESRVNLTNQIPVHITYFTAWVDEDGDLVVRDDVYGHDARIEKALSALGV